MLKFNAVAIMVCINFVVLFSEQRKPTTLFQELLSQNCLALAKAEFPTLA